MKLAVRFLLVLVALVAVVLAVMAWLLPGALPASTAPSSDVKAPGPASSVIDQGEYLARAGDCVACHTAATGKPFAGGRAMPTPFGALFVPNITPDDDTGIGRWSADDFYRMMHTGVSRDGTLLYPAMPFASYTKVTRADSDAIYAYLMSVPPVRQANRPHELKFPFNNRDLLIGWRTLYFRQGEFTPDPKQSAEWNRGAYLVGGLGHCIACHGSRNSLGATDTARGLVGGMLPGENWYAPALDAASEAGVAGWDPQEVVTLLKTGRTAHASVLGPMAEVVYRSTQYLSDADLRAMAVYLQALPQAPAAAPAPAGRRNEGVLQRGEKIYAQQCAWCHGERGEGVAGTFPPLAGNRAVNMRNASNLVQVVRRGGFLPATDGNPQPYGMPPFGHLLDDADIAAVLSYVRASWGNTGAEVTQREAMQR